ncbi:hypothetical protein GCM10010269_65150 [Streptomyces humidus]|uniref:Uncharacterized protein n=1 Tax=Streptomyces humidus TaxID=52259 RepID=A0A918L7G2_9ACTN|nr:hypothetical protein GCM10010269_65150 [Streptomyces humidus]
MRRRNRFSLFPSGRVQPRHRPVGPGEPAAQARTRSPAEPAAAGVMSARDPRARRRAARPGQGMHAAGTLMGEHLPFESVPYFWTHRFDATRAASDVSPRTAPSPYCATRRTRS